MHCEGKLKLRSHNTSYCLIEVVTKAGLTVYSPAEVLWHISLNDVTLLFEQWIVLKNLQFILFFLCVYYNLTLTFYHFRLKKTWLLVDRYGISVSQMTMDMFHLS